MVLHVRVRIGKSSNAVTLPFTVPSADEIGDQTTDDAWETFLMCVLSLSADADSALDVVALLDSDGVLVNGMSELWECCTAGRTPLRAVEGSGIDLCDSSDWQSICSYRLLAHEESSKLAASDHQSGSPAHIPTMSFSAPIAGCGASGDVFPQSDGAAFQPAYVVELGPGPDAKAPHKRRPFGLVCQACANMCVVPGKASPAPAASGRSLKFTCMTRQLALAGRLQASGAGMDVFEEYAGAGWEHTVSADAIRGALRRSMLSAGEQLAARRTDSAADSSGAGQQQARFLSRLRSSVQTVMRYERDDLQQQALAVVPVDDIWASAIEAENRKRNAKARAEADRREGRVLVSIGPSESNAKTVSLRRPENRGVGSTVVVDAQPQNAQDPSWTDRFSVEVQGNGTANVVLVVKRIDSPSEGWGQDLQLSAKWNQPRSQSSSDNVVRLRVRPEDIPRRMREIVTSLLNSNVSLVDAVARAFAELTGGTLTSAGTFEGDGGTNLSLTTQSQETAVDQEAFRNSPRGRHMFLVHLLKWFKKDFFKWCNAPPCDTCGSGNCQPRGSGVPTEDERRWGAHRVEVYSCQQCSNNNVRFPRFNDPAKLLETRRGRCGEWANTFTLVCRALGFESRYVFDWTDHVWTEVWSEMEQRWLHADSCEAALDRPLCYEAGWGKSLTYVIAFSRFGCTDVTRRYSQHWYVTTRRRHGHA